MVNLSGMMWESSNKTWSELNSALPGERKLDHKFKQIGITSFNSLLCHLVCINGDVPVIRIDRILTNKQAYYFFELLCVIQLSYHFQA